MSRMKQHPAAESFPMMDERRFRELVDDIREHGQRVRIVLCDGLVLDGRNRWLACEEIGIEPKTENFKGGDPWEYVWSLNGSRRDLTADQRYLIWKHCHECSEAWQTEQKRIEDEANRKRSESVSRHRSGCEPEEGQVTGQSDPAPALPLGDTREHPTREAKAEASGTNPSAVKRADKLAKDRPDLAEQVRLGNMKPAEAYRQMKKDAVCKKVAKFPKGKFRVVYADPPWSYGDKLGGEISEHYGSAENHYPCMSVSDICNMPLADHTTKDAVLFLWVTSPLLPEGLRVMAAWGFKYKASFVWDKVKHNMGHYNSVRHEFLLMGTKGSCVPDKTKLFDSVQSIERTGHSEKPDQFRNIIQTLYQHGQKVELFARKASRGWKVFGNEL